jgi:hypothetical protein
MSIKLASAFNPVIVQVLLACRRTSESIGSVDPGRQSKKLTTEGAFFERPCPVKRDGKLAHHGAKQTSGTEDKPWQTVLL